MLAAIIVNPMRFPNLPLLSSLGAASYSLYLVHPVAIALTAHALHQSAGTVPLCLYIVSSVMLGSVFYVLVERRFIQRRA
jgi:peptidoglycan/LPS O-acetylase OafA/YrhL